LAVYLDLNLTKIKTFLANDEIDPVNILLSVAFSECLSGLGSRPKVKSVANIFSKFDVVTGSIP